MNILLFFILIINFYSLENNAQYYFNNKNYDRSLELSLLSEKEEMILLSAKIYEIKKDIKTFEYYRKYFEKTNYEDKNLIFYVGNLATKYLLYETAFDFFIKDDILFENIIASAITARFIGKYNISKEKYTKALEIENDNYEVILGLAIVNQMLSMFKESISYFKRSLLIKEDEHVVVTLAEIYLYLNMIDEAKDLINNYINKFNSKKLRDIFVEIYNK